MHFSLFNILANILEKRCKRKKTDKIYILTAGESNFKLETVTPRKPEFSNGVVNIHYIILDVN